MGHVLLVTKLKWGWLLCQLVLLFSSRFNVCQGLTGMYMVDLNAGPELLFY